MLSYKLPIPPSTIRSQSQIRRKTIEVPFNGYNKAPINDFALVEFECDVVDVNVPLLLEIPGLNNNGVFINNMTSKMVHHYLGWEVPVTYKHGHLFYCWDPDHDFLFTRSELHKRHMQFYHPSVNKLFNIFRRGRPEDIDEDTRTMQSEIDQSCKTCMEVKRRPCRFSVAIPDNDIVFNRELLIYVFFSYGKPVLSMADKDTNFISSFFLMNESAKEIWPQFVLLWVNALAGYPDIIRHDQARVVRSEFFTSRAQDHGIEIKSTGTESHHSLAAGETCHDSLRRVYHKVRATHDT